MKRAVSPARWGDAFRAYLITSWLMFGAFLCYAVFALPLRDYAAFSVADFLPFLFVVPFVLLLFPVLIAGGSFTSAIGLWQQQQYLLSFVCFAVVVIVYLIGRSVWYLLYGQKQTGVSHTP